MKNLLFSTYTKAFAVILFLASLILSFFAGIHGAEYLFEEDNYIYDFGTSFEDCYHFRHLAALPENAVFSTFQDWRFWEEMDITAPTAPDVVDIYEESTGIHPTEDPAIYQTPTTAQDKPLLPWDEKKLLAIMEKRLNELPYLDNIEFYVNLNGTVFSNNQVADPIALRNGLYMYFSLDSKGNMEFYSTMNSYDMPRIHNSNIMDFQPNPLIIATRIRPEYVEDCSVLWNKQETILYTTAKRLLICAITFLLSLIYLICVCGKDKDGKGKEWWVDRIWAEFHLAAMGVIGIGITYLCSIIVEEAFEQRLPQETAYLLPCLMIPLGGGLILCSLLSLIRNLKAGLFAKRCGVLIVAKKLLSCLWAFCKMLWKGFCGVIRTFASVRGIPCIILQIFLLLLYSVGSFFLVVLIGEGTESAMIPLIILWGGAAFLLILRGKDLDSLQKGAARIRMGDLSHQIPLPKTQHLKPLAEDMNHIAKGLDASLAARMKAERMKTELITNVSHDLKTPLTSIITYTELLSRIDNLPQEAQDYIRIIDHKSQKLKSLTQDLFDISKVQSGNEEVQWELLDAALLLEQSLAEEKVDTEALQFCLKAEEGLAFMGDGRKLCRVLGNLIQNAMKYSLAGTRIFLSAYKEENRVVIECKNISSYPLDFSPEEIMGRFVRGDSARSTEGNGLGLPIAKSYTELCGGDFRLLLDGDLFKVLLSFPAS